MSSANLLRSKVKAAGHCIGLFRDLLLHTETNTRGTDTTPLLARAPTSATNASVAGMYRSGFAGKGITDVEERSGSYTDELPHQYLSMTS